MSKYQTKSFDYVIFDTNYTSRIWNKVAENGNATINEDHKFIKGLCDKLYEKYEMDIIDMEVNEIITTDDLENKTKKELLEILAKNDEKVNLIELIFSYDQLCLYKNNNKETDKIIQILKEADEYKDGIMCFKCNGENLNILTDLMKYRENNDVQYCNVYCITDIKILSNQKKEDPSFMIIEYDTESG